MPFPKQTIYDLDSSQGKQAIVRVDFNVPLDDSTVSDTTRLKAAVPTIEHLLDEGASVLLMSHLGRPGGTVEDELRLDPVVEPLSDLLDIDVRKADDVIGDSALDLSHSLKPGEVGLLENLRFHPGEKSNDDEFARQLASFADFYVNDAFGAAHRAHASITGVPEHLRPAVAGELLYSEYEVLSEVRDNPNRPFMAILGGAKISDKLPVIEQFLDRADRVLVGGAMAYTFALAQGKQIGDSLVEENFVEEARSLLDHDKLVLPDDVVITPS
ncbi:MAG: phosphoglycerate kinase, partial [bacterium]